MPFSAPDLFPSGAFFASATCVGTGRGTCRGCTAAVGGGIFAAGGTLAAGGGTFATGAGAAGVVFASLALAFGLALACQVPISLKFEVAGVLVIKPESACRAYIHNILIAVRGRCGVLAVGAYLSTTENSKNFRDRQNYIIYTHIPVCMYTDHKKDLHTHVCIYIY